MGTTRIEYKLIFNNKPVLKDRVLDFIEMNKPILPLLKTREIAIMLGVSQQYLKRLMNEYN
jgi:AraC-like DNA-binding protein